MNSRPTLYRGKGKGEGEAGRKETGHVDLAVAAAAPGAPSRPSKARGILNRLMKGAEQSKENASSSKQQRGGLSKKKEVNGVDAETAVPGPAAFSFASAAIFGTILDVFYVAVLVRILSSWFRGGIPPLLDPVINLAGQITEPVFAPFRQLIPPIRLGSTLVDISGIIVILLINFLRRQIY